MKLSLNSLVSWSNKEIILGESLANHSSVVPLKHMRKFVIPKYHLGSECRYIL